MGLGASNGDLGFRVAIGFKKLCFSLGLQVFGFQDLAMRSLVAGLLLPRVRLAVRIILNNSSI